MRAPLLLLALGVASCYSPSVKDGLYTCPNNGACPDNLACNACGVCVQASEPLDAQAMCPADMTMSGGCKNAILCVIQNCLMLDTGFQNCLNVCAQMATPATQSMYLDPFINCIQSACKCDTGTCKACAGDAIKMMGSCGIGVHLNCGACFAEYNACYNAP